MKRAEKLWLLLGVAALVAVLASLYAERLFKASIVVFGIVYAVNLANAINISRRVK